MADSLSPQIIPMGDIDPAKLARKLQKLFGTEYEVYMRHSDYSIRARRHLTQNEIDECITLGPAAIERDHPGCHPARERRWSWRRLSLMRPLSP